MSPSAEQPSSPQSPVAATPPTRYLLWIDGVGAYLLCLGSRLTIGGPAVQNENGNADAADIPLLANLSRSHVCLMRSGEGYLLEAHGPVSISGRSVERREALPAHCELQLGGNVRLQFDIPSPLSRTARLSFLSDHRPSRSVDGIVLMDETCLFGPGIDSHIPCPDWTDSLLLYQRDGRFWCQSRSKLLLEGLQARDSLPIEPGRTVSGVDFRFHLEPVSVM